MLSIDVSQSEELRAYLAKGFRKSAIAGVQGAAAKVVQKITAQIIPTEPRPPVDRGAYRAGWRMKPTKVGADIINTVPYAGIIEHGARASNIKIGRAMITALTSWARRKGLGGKKEAASVAWAVATSMKKKGIFNNGQGLGILRKAIVGLNAILVKEIGAEIEKEFKK